MNIDEVLNERFRGLPPAVQDALRPRLEALVGVMEALCDVVREEGKVPAGHLYAACAGTMGLDDFTGVIRFLERAGLVKYANHTVLWTGSTE